MKDVYKAVWNQLLTHLSRKPETNYCSNTNHKVSYHFSSNTKFLQPPRIFRTKDGIATGYLFSDTLVTKDFNVHLLGESATKVTVNQYKEDVERIGNLTTAGQSNEVIQFRAVRKVSQNAIPLLRNKEREYLFPIAAIRHGEGHFIIGGMNIVSDSEFEKLASCVHNWLTKKIII